MNEVKHSERKVEIPCEGSCGYLVKWVDCQYISDDPYQRWYGMYTKDELKSIVCLDCYAKGIELHKIK